MARSNRCRSAHLHLAGWTNFRVNILHRRNHIMSCIMIEFQKCERLPQGFSSLCSSQYASFLVLAQAPHLVPQWSLVPFAHLQVHLQGKSHVSLVACPFPCLCPYPYPLACCCWPQYPLAVSPVLCPFPCHAHDQEQQLSPSLWKQLAFRQLTRLARGGT